MDCPNELPAQFVTDYHTVNDALNLAEAFKNVLNGQYKKDFVISPTLLTIEIWSDFTCFYHDPEYSPFSDPVVQMDTSAFKEIVRAWQYF